MYINEIEIQDFRTFRQAGCSFIHGDADFDRLGIPKPRLANINLLLGANGQGKTTMLKAIALACLGPAVGDAGIYPSYFVRREPRGGKKPRAQPEKTSIKASFEAHRQDDSGHARLESQIEVIKREDLESLRWTHPEEKRWHPIFSSTSDALFFVGYGSNRRTERAERIDLSGRSANSFVRAQRVMSLFEDTHSLVPLNVWLPAFQEKNPARFVEFKALINALSGTLRSSKKRRYEFTGQMRGREYLFMVKGVEVPFPALSDGYRAFLGWISDLLYHVCTTCPDDKKLVDNKGIVMVDEIDLHLHPEWQMTVLPTLARALPNIQFIATTHSPLVVGSLEWMNVLTLKSGPNNSSLAKRIKSPIGGLDADQILLTPHFGLTSTRTSRKSRRLKTLTERAREGDPQAALALLEEMSSGMEKAQ